VIFLPDLYLTYLSCGYIYTEFQKMKKFLLFSFALATFAGLTGGVSAQQRTASNSGSVLSSRKSNASIGNSPIKKSRTENVTQLSWNRTSVAGCDTLVWVDFQNMTIPTTWLNLDVDGSTDQNNRPQNFYISREDSSLLGSTNSTNYGVAASSWFNPAGIADNWLIMDSFTVCDANLALVYKSAPFQGGAGGFMDGYKVMVSTSNNNTSSFTTMIGEFAEGIGSSTTNFSSGTVHTNYNSSNGGILTTYVLPLGSFLNQTIYIGFHHDSDDDNGIMFDDITVVKLNTDASTSNLNLTTDYVVIPTSQVQPIGMSAVLTNTGSGTLTNAPVAFEVLDGTLTSIFSATGTATGALTVNQFATATASTNFTPSLPDVYNFISMPGASIGDMNAANDTSFNFVVIDDSTYSRENGFATGALGIDPTLDGVMGQTFTLYAADTLTSMTFLVGFPGAAFGDTYNGVVRSFGPIPSNYNLATFVPVTITDSTISVYTVDVTGGDLVLPAGTYFFGFTEDVPQLLSMAYTTSYFTPQTAWAYFDPGTGYAWQALEDINAAFSLSFILRPNFGPSAGSVITSVNETLETAVKVYPNPANDNLTISLGGLEGTVEIMNILGATVYTSGLTNGSVSVATAGLPAGIYTVKTSSNGKSVYNKVNILH